MPTLYPAASGRTPLLRALAWLALLQLTAPAWAEDPPATADSLSGSETVIAEVAVAPLPTSFDGLLLALPDADFDVRADIIRRLAAAQRLIAADDISPEQLALVQQQLGKEQDSTVKDLLTSVAAASALASESPAERRAAIKAKMASSSQGTASMRSA